MGGSCVQKAYMHTWGARVSQIQHTDLEIESSFLPFVYYTGMTPPVQW